MTKLYNRGINHNIVYQISLVTKDVAKYVFVFKYVDLVYLYLNDYSVIYLYLIVVFGWEMIKKDELEVKGYI